MRVALSLALMLTLSPLRADRLLRLPLANSLFERQVILEDMFSTGNHSHVTFLQVGFPAFVEVGAVAEAGRLGANVQYSFVQPFPEYSPGVAAGILDVGNSTLAGRAAWIAATWQFNVYADWADRERISFTLGTGTAPRFKGAFVSLDLPVYRGWNLFMEHDARTLTLGLGFNPSENILIRAVIVDGVPAYALKIRLGF